MGTAEHVNGFSTIHLAGNIRHLRKRMNISQEELAQRVGLNRGNIASYENGTAEPRICSLMKLAHVFGVSISDLTLRDLSDEETFALASTVFRQNSEKDQLTLDNYHSKAGELKAVLEGYLLSLSFKLNSYEEDVPKDVQYMAMKVEELYDVASSIMHHHENLIEFVKCRLKHNSNC